MRALLVFMFVFCGFGVAGAQTRVEITETLNVHYYDLSGQSVRDLRLGFRARSRPGMMAETRAGLATNLDYAFTQDSCRLARVSLHASIDIEYPNWVERHQASDELRAEWDRFMIALEAHETGHADIFRTGLQALKTRIESIMPSADCASLRTAFDGELDAFNRQMDELQNAYERDTRRGALQGARLVPTP